VTLHKLLSKGATKNPPIFFIYTTSTNACIFDQGIAAGGKKKLVRKTSNEEENHINSA